MPYLFNFALISILGFSLFFSDPARAAEPARVILVFDASGSMWQRIENKEKILIAREVIGDILEAWNPRTELGLVAYGHRRKGDCDDIETLVPVGSGDPATIRRLINEIQPKGKTPLTAAVQKAAQDLRYTEEKATVILISDGKETCDLDPCAMGEALEKAGVDFTAHVIGFDIADDEREPLQCLAEATGGLYFDAREAEELKVALTEAVEQVQTEPDRIVAVLDEGMPPLTDVDIQWSAVPVSGGPTLTGSGDSFTLPPDAGTYTVTARLGQAEGSTRIDVTEEQAQQHVVALDAGRLILKAKVNAPEGAVGTPDIKWSIMNLAEEVETARASGTEASLYLDSKTYGVFASLGEQSKNEIVRLEPGSQQEVTFEFEITPASLTAPEEAPAGSFIDIVWEGPDTKNDYLSVASPEAKGHQYVNYAYTRGGNPASLQMPDAPGLYELRYVSGQSKTVLSRRPIAVTEVSANLSAPDSAPAGEIVQIIWEGPDNKNDYLSVASPEAKGHQYVNYAYTRRGNPASLKMPDAPGLYELRYISGQSKTVLSRRPVLVTEVSASLNALNTVPVNEAVRLEWQGPDNKNDYLSVASPEAKGHQYVNYAYTNRGNPASLKMPKESGIYELRYVMGQSKTVLARRPIRVVSEEEFTDYLASAPPGQVTLQVIDAATGEPVREDLGWMVYGIQGAQNMQRANDAQPQFSLPPGVYRANVSMNGAAESVDFILNAGENIVQSITR